MAPRGRRNKEILPKEVLETKNILNSKLSLTSNALNYRKYKKSKILWTYTQSYAHYKPQLKILPVKTSLSINITLKRNLGTYIRLLLY